MDVFPSIETLLVFVRASSIEAQRYRDVRKKVDDLNRTRRIARQAPNTDFEIEKFKGSSGSGNE
jgi:hypothetical protein